MDRGGWTVWIMVYRGGGERGREIEEDSVDDGLGIQSTGSACDGPAHRTQGQSEKYSKNIASTTHCMQYRTAFFFDFF